ncbi:MAG: hypothetical protein OEM51_07965 [Gammaproteobacteria bacterium]|nr:hypothetical protein [Gammaproteobacteria bacterium]MDH3429532.1 hypothetical protein [Gammaproteobacteria bacterium]
MVWPADSRQLVGSGIDMTGGNTLRATDTLFLSGLASGGTLMRQRGRPRSSSPQNPS